MGGGAMERFDTQWEGPLGAWVPLAKAGASQKNYCRCGDLERMKWVFVYLCVGVLVCSVCVCVQCGEEEVLLGLCVCSVYCWQPGGLSLDKRTKHTRH